MMFSATTSVMALVEPKERREGWIQEYAINVMVGGEYVDFDVEPRLINDRTMVPLRAIFEALDAEVSWDDATQTVTATHKDTTVSLTINSNKMYVNGEVKTLDIPACLVDGRTLVPVRAISEAFDLKVEWNENTKTVRVRVPVSLLVENSAGEKCTYDKNGNKTYYEKSNGSWEKYIVLET